MANTTKSEKDHKSPLVYKYNDNQLVNVSKSPEDQLKLRAKEDKQELERAIGNGVNITCECNTKTQNNNLSKNSQNLIQKISIISDTSKTVTVTTPVRDKKSKISFNVQDGEVWRNF